MIDVTVPSVSGMFIDLDKRGLLGEFRGLVQKRASLDRQLQDTERQLIQINDLEWVLAYSARVESQGKNVTAELTRRAESFEARKEKLISEKIKVENRLDEIAPAVKIPELKAPLPEVEPSDQGNRDPDVSERNR